MSAEFKPSDIKLVSLDGVLTHKVACPGCGTWAYCDDDQYFGRVSLHCTECGWHETHDLSDVDSGRGGRR